MGGEIVPKNKMIEFENLIMIEVLKAMQELGGE